MPRLGSLAAAIALVTAVPSSSRAADAIPDRLTDEAFWSSVESASEPSGTFFAENLVSNELKYPEVLRHLQKAVKPGGVFIGVGPEQNFNYAAALRPSLVFVIDIRRQNLIEHLMYKALFELSSNRAEFLSRLFARRLPADLEATLPGRDLLAATAKLEPDLDLFQENLSQILERLVHQHGFALSHQDELDLERVYRAFVDGGLAISYGRRTGPRPPTAAPPVAKKPGSGGSSSYLEVMTAVDSKGECWSYLATDAAFQRVRDLELRNLIVPVVGDVAGPKALPWIASFLKDHHATVSVLYLSNVEMYVFSPKAAETVSTENGGWANYTKNVSSLPIDPASRLVRFPGADGPGSVHRIEQDLRLMRNGRFPRQSDLE